KISEGILRIQGKVSTQNDLTAGGNRLPETVPALPQGAGHSGAGVEVMTSRTSEATPRPPSDATIKETTKKLRDNLDQLQAAREKSHSDLETARKEKELVNARLQQSNSKLDKAKSEIEKSKKAEERVGDKHTKDQ